MNLYRLKIRPLATWATPWRADTLFGHLCSVAAMAWGGDFLHDEILAPALDGKPPFVCSDAFPGDLLPVPLFLRLRDWGEVDGKRLKKARWLSSSAFRRVQAGEGVGWEDLLPDLALVSGARTRNVIGRLTDTTGENALFSVPEWALNLKWEPLKEAPYLSVYVRVEAGFRARLEYLFKQLGERGFGADASVGRGAFAVLGGLEPVDWLDAGASSANGVVVLSTFQPAAGDPLEGYWEMFVKHGKLGADLGLEDVFKRPMTLFRPGACFVCDTALRFMGRALRGEEFLSEAQCEGLEGRGIYPIHGAFGLTVPCCVDVA